jgi:ADP-ribose pyrophosphatase
MADVVLSPWAIRSERTLLSCPPYIEVSVQSVELPDGQIVRDFYQLRLADFVCIFAETAAGDVLTLRSYRHGPRRICLNFPGGRLAEGEPALDAAKRELLEETGYEGAHWQALGSFVTQGNQRGQTAHFFRASGCRYVATADSGDLEQAQLIQMPLPDVLAAMRRGEFATVDHIALLALVTQSEHR